MPSYATSAIMPAPAVGGREAELAAWAAASSSNIARQSERSRQHAASKAAAAAGNFPSLLARLAVDLRRLIRS